MASFGSNLIEIRKGKGLAQKTLAEMLNITPTRLNYWEKDKRFPDLDMIRKLAEALQVPVASLVSWDDPKISGAVSNEVNRLESFEKFMSSLGYAVQSTVVKWHWESEDQEVKIPDEWAFSIAGGETGKSFLFNQAEFDQFRKNVEAAVEFELFKAGKQSGSK